MSDKNLARRTRVEVSFDGVDITPSIVPYLLNLSYTDREDGETDDLQITLQDSSGIWATSWLSEMIDAAASSSTAPQLQIKALIVRQNWSGDGLDEVLDTGDFSLDKVECGGPPSTVKIAASSLPYSSQIRQTKRSKAWESYTLSGIASEMASVNNMACMYLSAKNPYYKRVEQYHVSNIEFLQQLCHDAGCSLKATNKTIVIFDQAEFENKTAIRAITKGDGSYTSYKLSASTADTKYASCRVYYNDPETGACISAVATSDESKSDGQQLEINCRVASIGEAQALAEKNLRLHNKYAQKVSFDMPGEPSMLAGVCISLSGWGSWDGKYIISQAKHTVDSSGYQTRVTARKVLEGY